MMQAKIYANTYADRFNVSELNIILQESHVDGREKK